jgi:twitching motility protein PilJ
MLAEEAEAQSRHIVETSQEIGHMADTIREVANTADSSRRVAEQSLITVRAGADKVESTIQSMGHLREQVQETSKRIKRLGENAQEIGETVQLIGDIAYRTSVLALNASIQAARAGEAGRGFGVVAEEVDRLSKRSTEAARRIAELIKTAQTSTNSAIASMEENTRNVVESTLFLQEAGHSLHNLESVTGKLAEMIGSISTLTERQNQQSSAVAQTMLDISHATQLTANGIKRSSNTVNQLAELADDLQGSVAAFRINKQAAHVTRALNGKAKAVAKA